MTRKSVRRADPDWADDPLSSDVDRTLFEEMREALQFARGFLARGQFETGCCYCGDLVDAHNIGSGHAPVDEGMYAANCEAERIDAVLRKIASRVPNYCRPCGEMLTGEQSECPSCLNAATPIDEVSA